MAPTESCAQRLPPEPEGRATRKFAETAISNQRAGSHIESKSSNTPDHFAIALPMVVNLADRRSQISTFPVCALLDPDVFYGSSTS